MKTVITESQIIEQENKLYVAIKERDVNVLEKLLHDNLLFIIPSGEVIGKEMDLQTYRDGLLKIDELQPEVENLNIIDDVAAITLTMQLKGRFNEQEFEAKYRYIRFWKKFEDAIKVVGGAGIAV